MSVKSYDILKGEHSSKGLNFGLTFKHKIKFRACFTKSCLYDLKNNNNYDINKLFGFSTTWSHHRQSARVGWRCIDGNKIQLLTYSYNDSKRAIEEADMFAEVNIGDWFICEIIDLESSYQYRFSLENDPQNRITVSNNPKQKDWFLFHYLLFPYFGGNEPAPHNMKIYLEKI
jgi:hypothetical protein